MDIAGSWGRAWSSRVLSLGRGPGWPLRRTTGFERRSLSLTLIGRPGCPGGVGVVATFAVNGRSRLLRPATLALAEEWISPAGLRVGFSLGRTPASYGLNSSAHGSSDPYGVRVVPSSTFDAIAGGEESIEALDEVRVPGEQLGDAVNNPGRVDPK